MKNNLNAILIHESDNVVTVTTDLKKGDTLLFQRGDDVIELVVLEDVPVFHKVAIADIEKDAPVYKYGQLIGKVVMSIAKGNHVHDHNIESPDK